MTQRTLTPNSARNAAWQARGLGTLTSTMAMAALWLLSHTPGVTTPPTLSTARFSVAVLAGAKQAAQSAPKDAAQTAESTTPTTEPATTSVAVPDRSTSLPDAVAATPDATPGPEVAKPVEVMPPAEVSMPGGQLMANDAPAGTQPDPFAIGPQQVYLRLFVNAKGQVIRGGIVRSGTEPMRDALILKAMASRTYSTKNLIRVEGAEPQWQLDLVIDYGTSEFIP